MKKYGQKDKLPKHIADAHDEPIADKDLDAKRRHQPADDHGDANRKDKD